MESSTQVQRTPGVGSGSTNQRLSSQTPTPSAVRTRGPHARKDRRLGVPNPATSPWPPGPAPALRRASLTLWPLPGGHLTLLETPAVGFMSGEVGNPVLHLQNFWARGGGGGEEGALSRGVRAPEAVLAPRAPRGSPPWAVKLAAPPQRKRLPDPQGARRPLRGRCARLCLPGNPSGPIWTRSPSKPQGSPERGRGGTRGATGDETPTGARKPAPDAPGRSRGAPNPGSALRSLCARAEPSSVPPRPPPAPHAAVTRRSGGRARSRPQLRQPSLPRMVGRWQRGSARRHCTGRRGVAGAEEEPGRCPGSLAESSPATDEEVAPGPGAALHEGRVCGASSAGRARCGRAESTHLCLWSDCWQLPGASVFSLLSLFPFCASQVMT